ncbi:hypothetical protein [Intrasporangium sp. DVR]|uniref:hypothetical protein n=1 Tax=Intrasporangium sp. DVR TaxID=3127867 RepID=UPI00313A56D5
MTLDQRLSAAARHLGDRVVPPDVDLDTVRSQARRDRRRSVSLVVLSTVVALTLAGTALLRRPEPVRLQPASPQSSASQERIRSSTSAMRLPAVGALAPGTYVMPRIPGAVADYRHVLVTVPAGWSWSRGRIHKRLGEPGEVALSAWTVQGIYDDPCHWRESPVSEQDLADEHVHGRFDPAPMGATIPTPVTGGLANQLGRNASTPTKVELGGVSALRIELSVSAALDLDSCDQSQFRSWTGRNAATTANTHHAPGQVDVVYLVDLDREPLVIDVSHLPGTTAADLAEVDATLASMVVERGR